MTVRKFRITMSDRTKTFEPFESRFLSNNEVMSSTGRIDSATISSCVLEETRMPVQQFLMTKFLIHRLPKNQKLL